MTFDVKEAIERIQRSITQATQPQRLVPEINKVIFNDRATIILWDDGIKTVVRCSEGDVYDAEKGMAMAIAKRAMGNQAKYHEEFYEWLPKKETLGDILGQISESITITGVAKKIEPTEEIISNATAKLAKTLDARLNAFDKYCRNCKYEDLPGSTEPCCSCDLSNKHLNWEPKESESLKGVEIAKKIGEGFVNGMKDESKSDDEGLCWTCKYQHTFSCKDPCDSCLKAFNEDQSSPFWEPKD